MGKLLTVGIPVFNGKSLLRNCLQSVVDSSLPRDDFEILIADDGSSDPETFAILDEFERRLAASPGFFRVILLGENSGGAARPRNRIIDEARGAYIFFVDSDDTIGELALERIGDAVAGAPTDWIALNEVAVNGRAGIFRARRPLEEVPRARALATLTVHKVFRRAEIERQGLRFDEALPSGQDVAFAFSYILSADRFLVLGGYDFYRLTQHGEDPNQPVHLSRTADHSDALIEKNERILRRMLAALRACELPEGERHEIAARVILPRILVREKYLRAIVYAGPDAGGRALRRLSELLADPLITGIDPGRLDGVLREHLAVVGRADWDALARLVRPHSHPVLQFRSAARWFARGRRFVDTAVIRARHRRLGKELVQLQRSVDDLRKAQHRLETTVGEDDLRHLLADPDGFSQDWPLSSRALQESVRRVLAERPGIVVEVGAGASTLWLGRALRMAGGGRLIALEGSAEWADVVAGLVRHEGLDGVEVRHASPDEAAEALTDVGQIDLLLAGSGSAPPALRDRLRPGATVIRAS